MYDDFIFAGKNCRDFGTHAFFGETTTIGTTISRNLYDLPGGIEAEIGEASYKSVTRKVTLTPMDGREADEAFCRQIVGWLCAKRGRLTLERDPDVYRICSFDKAAELDNKSWPDGCIQLTATMQGLAFATHAQTASATTSGGKATLRAGFDTDIAAPLRLDIKVTSGTVTAATIVVGGKSLALSGLSAASGKTIRYEAGDARADLPPILSVDGVQRFGTVKAWKRLKVTRGQSIGVMLTGGEAVVTAYLRGRWIA